jgi:hypothetical protein
MTMEPLDYREWIECWQCAGDGELADCWEEYACIDPEGGCDECMKRCDICRGKGGWHAPEDSAPDRCERGEGGL